MASGNVNSNSILKPEANNPIKKTFAKKTDKKELTCEVKQIPVNLTDKSAPVIESVTEENVQIIKDENNSCPDLSLKGVLKDGQEVSQNDCVVTSVVQQLSTACTLEDALKSTSLTNQINPTNVCTLSEISSGKKSLIYVEKDSHVTLLRKPSYQQAMANKDLQSKYVPGILFENSYSPIDECEGIPEDNILTTKLNQSSSFDSPRSTSPLQHESPDKSLTSLIPQESPTSTNISRSISFNDRLLDTSRRPQLEAFKCSSVESNISSIDSPSLQSSANVRLLQSTPGRLQIISKQSFGTSPPDCEFYGSPNSITKEKNTIKSFTSNLTRRISFRKNKSKLNREKSFETANINGISPSEDRVVSYECLLKLFECPGCHTFMVPPLLQCRKGHIVCDKCKVSFKATCPICKQRVTDTSNYMMEQVCQLVRFPCSFMKYGCPEYHSPKLRVDHENFCIFRPVHCHYESAGCENVLPLKEMNSHISSCQFKYKTMK